MAKVKISELTAKGSNLASTDLVPIAEDAGGGIYTTKSVNGTQIGGGGSGLTVGTTAITSGTIGRVFFEGTGNVLQQDAAFFWDNTNKRLGIGATPSSSVRLDVRAQGTLSTDVAFRVRNSADTGNIFEVRGNGHSVFNNEVFIGFGAGPAGQGHYFNMRFAGSTSIPFAYFDNNSNNLDIDRFCNIKLGYSLIAANSTHSLLLGLGTQPSSRNYQQTMASLTCISQGTNDSGFSQSGADTSGNNSLYYNYFGRNFVIGSTTQGTGSRKIVINSGTAPSTNLTDAFQLYSADRGGVAGKASAYFRTEDGSINVLGDLSGIGTSTPQARLDVIAQGALGTDIAFRIRNSADSANLFQVNGDNSFSFLNRITGDTGGLGLRLVFGNACTMHTAANHVNITGSRIEVDSAQTMLSTNAQQNVRFASSTGGAPSQIMLNYYNAQIHLGGSLTDSISGTNVFSALNGTAPTVSLTDRFQLYSADIVAGNAAAHFRTENGAIVKIYQETTAVTSATVVHNAGGTAIKTLDTFDGYTLDQVVKALRNLGILA